MVWHLVLMKPRPDLATDDRRALLGAFDRAVREIPSVRDVRIGRRLTHGAAYEQAPADFEFMISIAFDDLAGLQAYLAHPAHQDLGARFYQCISNAVVHDFDVEGVEALSRL